MYSFFVKKSNGHAPFFSPILHRSALFETKLADILLRNTPKDILFIVSTAIVELLERNVDKLRERFSDEALLVLSNELKHLNIDVPQEIEVDPFLNPAVDPIFLCIAYNLITNQDAYLQASLQKIFVEKIYFAFLIDPNQYQSETLTQRSLLKIATMSCNPNNASSDELVGEKTALIDYFRPDSLFATANRGRIKLGDDGVLTINSRPNKCFGILPQRFLPNEFKNKLPFPVFHAAAEYMCLIHNLHFSKHVNL